jgi:hypothetical protein
MTNLKSKRLTAGLYEVTVKDRVFHVEDIFRHSDGEALPGWMRYEVREGGERDFWNDFGTKREAMEAIEAEA